MILLPIATWILLNLYVCTFTSLNLSAQTRIDLLVAKSIDQSTQQLIMNETLSPPYSSSMQSSTIQVPPRGAMLQYSRTQLLELRNQPGSKKWLPQPVYTTLKDHGIFHMRSRRAGTHIRRRVNHSTENPNQQEHDDHPKQIPVHTTRLEKKKINGQAGPNLSNLRPIRHETLSNLNVHIWNARSLRNKTYLTCDYIIENDVDVMIITESWLKSDELVIIGECTPPGYTFLSKPRVSNNYGGGIAVIFKEPLKLSFNEPNIRSVSTFEYACVSDPTNQTRIFTIYRPPPSAENGLKTSEFLIEFNAFLEDVSSLCGKHLFVGDFNLHMDIPSKSDVTQFVTLLDEFGLQQHVVGATHKDGHCLDLVISHEGDSLVQRCNLTENLYSDHRVVQCKIDRSKPIQQKIESKSRNYREMDNEAFKSDLVKAFETFPYDGSASYQVMVYNQTVLDVLDNHCPVTTRTHTFKPHPPWYTRDVHLARRERRKLERRWRKTQDPNDRRAYLDQVHSLDKIIRSEKSVYYKDKLSSADNKTIFKTMNTLLNKSMPSLPSGLPMKDLSNNFSKYFTDKIVKIRHNITSTNSSHSSHSGPSDQCETFSPRMPHLSSFTLTDENEVLKVVGASPNKSCGLDPLPTWLLKDNITTFLPVLVSMVNTSLASGSFPSTLKDAIVSPVLKKPSLDKNDYKNYRPVSNVAFVSKLTEKIALERVNDHICTSNLSQKFQSAYRSGHSTETALLRVKSDIMHAFDNRRAVFLVLLDLSAAFDTIDHSALLDRLYSVFGISGVVYDWFVSYLVGWTSRVKAASELSDPQRLEFGLPQGSVVGPQMFSLYTQPLAKVIERYPQIKFQFYADDTQLFITVDPKKFF